MLDSAPCVTLNRQLNRALYFVAITRQRCDPITQDYVARRTSQGKTEREITRCLNLNPPIG